MTRVRLWSLGCLIAMGSAISFLVVELAVFLIQITPLPFFRMSATLPSSQTAIVLGASIKTPTEPSDALEDRLLTALDLYRTGHIRQILLTGDGGAYRSNEIVVMKQFLVDRQVPEHVLYVDPEGFRTYESCKRAREVYGISSAVIITQRFHLARSVFLCRTFGIDVVGISADRQRYRKRFFFALRELGASVKAVIDLEIRIPTPPVEK